MRLRLSAALAIVVPGLASAQAPAPSAKAVRRLDRAPVSREVLKVRLPRPAVRTLSNGLTVMVVEQHKLPTVQLSLWVKSGALSDPGDAPGLAKFAAELLREGTRSRTSAQLAAEVDELGASLEASAGFGEDVSRVQASGLVEDADKLLELLADVALQPTFPDEELAKYKKRQLAALEEQRANPQFLGRERFFSALYRETAPARIAPTAASIERVSASDLRAFHAARYRPGNAILGLAGDITLAEALPLVERRFGAWAGAPPAAAGPPPAPKPEGVRVHLVDRPGSVQTEIVAGSLALERTSPDFIALTVANRVLGGGPSARLFLQLREEKGYTYGAYSSFTADVYPGAFSARLAVRSEVTEPALRELLAELKRIGQEPVPAGELDEARRSIVAKFALSLESPANLLSSWMTARYFGLPED
ncbi:MAG: insulinase family protein [Elusimicrobia bacterium]|nr:insulinase family protein [Elusimicrobiota bacterium]